MMDLDRMCIGLGPYCVHCHTPLPGSGHRLCPELNDDVDLDEVRAAAPEPKTPTCSLDGCDEPVTSITSEYCSHEHKNKAIRSAVKELGLGQ